MILLIVVLCSISLCAEYAGPLGLKWGMTYEEVDSVLNGKFEKTEAFRDPDGSDSTVWYEGDFAGYKNAKVEAVFFKDVLIAVTASIPKQSAIPVSKSWFESIDKMKSKYGKPDSICLPPKKYDESPQQKTYQEKLMMKYLDASMSDYEFWDKIIETAKWQPSAYWKFKNAAIILSTVIENPNKLGSKNIMLTWFFFEAKSFLKWHTVIEKIKNKTADY